LEGRSQELFIAIDACVDGAGAGRSVNSTKEKTDNPKEGGRQANGTQMRMPVPQCIIADIFVVARVEQASQCKTD